MKSLTRLKWLAVLFAALFVLGGCLDDDDDEEAPEPPPDIEGDLRAFHAVADLGEVPDVLTGDVDVVIGPADEPNAEFTVTGDGSDERGTAFQTVEAQQGEPLTVRVAPHFEVNGDTVVGGEVGGSAVVDQLELIAGGSQSLFVTGAVGDSASALAVGALNDDFNASLPETETTEDWGERDFLTGYLDPETGLPYANLDDILVEAEVIESADDLAEASAVAALEELGAYSHEDFVDEYVDGGSLSDDAPGNLTDRFLAESAAPLVGGFGPVILGNTTCKDLDAIVEAEEDRVRDLADDDDDIDFEDVKDDIFTADEFFASDWGGNLAAFEFVFGSTGVDIATSNDVTVEPGEGYAAIRAGHLDPGEGAVDVYVTRPNTEVSNEDIDPRFEGVSFGNFTGFREIRLREDQMRIHITEAGTRDVLYTYLLESDMIDGAMVNAVAMDNFANPGDVTPLVAQAMTNDPDFAVTPPLPDNSGEVRFAHANPDVDELAISYRATANGSMGPRVEVGVLNYGDYTGYLRFFSEFDGDDAVYDIQAIDEAGNDRADDLGLEDYEITPGMAYTGIAIDDGGLDLIATGSDIPMTAPAGPDETGDVTIRAIHAVDGAGDVDIAVSGNDSATFEDVSFRDVTDYAGLDFEEDMNCDVADAEEFTVSVGGDNVLEDIEVASGTYSAIAVPEDPEDDTVSPYVLILEDR